MRAHSLTQQTQNV